MKINCKPLEEVDCLSTKLYMEFQVSVNGGCEREVIHKRNE